MAQQMAVKHGVRIRGSDTCGFCGERLALGGGLVGWLRARASETEWDGTRWVPYHRLCWQQRQYQRRRRQGC